MTRLRQARKGQHRQAWRESKAQLRCEEIGYADRKWRALVPRPEAASGKREFSGELPELDSVAYPPPQIDNPANTHTHFTTDAGHSKSGQNHALATARSLPREGRSVVAILMVTNADRERADQDCESVERTLSEESVPPGRRKPQGGLIWEPRFLNDAPINNALKPLARTASLIGPATSQHHQRGCSRSIP
jgi:hypothetical protein